MPWCAVQRRRTAEDELNMRKVFREGDLISVSAAADATPPVVHGSVCSCRRILPTLLCTQSPSGRVEVNTILC